jgi:hypothetical protein
MQELFALSDARGAAADPDPLLRSGLRHEPRAGMFHNWLGLVLKRKGDRRGAEMEFRQALEVTPDLVGCMANLGGLYLEEGRASEAAAVLQGALDRDAHSVGARQLIVALGLQRDVAASGPGRRGGEARPEGAADLRAPTRCVNGLDDGRRPRCVAGPWTRASRRAAPARRSNRRADRTLRIQVGPMIARLSGTLIEKRPGRRDRRGGVGYEVTIRSRPSLAGRRGRMSTPYTHVREICWRCSASPRVTRGPLWPPWSERRRPEAAVAMMWAAGAEDLVDAVRRRDVRRLSSVPGIGRKTAERIALESPIACPPGRAPGDGPTGGGAGVWGRSYRHW